VRNIYLPILAAIIFLGGCSGFMMQSNRESTITDSISTSAYKITYCGEGYMPKREAEKLAMQRASELVIRKGYTHFVIMQRSDKSVTCQLEDIPRDTYQKGMKSTYNESLAGPQNLVRPNIILNIQCYNKADAPKDAIDAKQYLINNPVAE